MQHGSGSFAVLVSGGPTPHPDSARACASGASGPHTSTLTDVHREISAVDAAMTRWRSLVLCFAAAGVFQVL